ncbi:MAG: alkane 1-monooxygenase, partial [Paracoccaceae bacterium]|nr:alkane 1-monooxygenase [Paracoccaceae bacterium]
MSNAFKPTGVTHALPFWLSLALVPAVVFAAATGGWALLLPPLCSWVAFAALDGLLGTDPSGADPETPDEHLFWYRLITLIWFPVQFVILFGTIAYAAHAEHLDSWEKIALFFGVGILTGTVGINFSHELMHQKDKFERQLADLLLASVLYSHFRSEHILVHHRYVGTPRDAVTARYNEGFYKFFLRVLHQSLGSAWRAEKAKLARKGLPWWDGSNPFWLYWSLQGGFILLAMILGGWVGIGLFLIQAFVAIWQLELVNYVEHYGLTRKYLGDHKYERFAPRHSWNASHRASNWLLINLQRHSDHHLKPDRRFPLLHTYSKAEAP